jgi:pimeloyl-ACP methyl ester carboxylesterase
MDHAMFDPQLDALLPEYRVLTWDVRGHGESRPLQEAFTLDDAAGDLVAILDEVGSDKAVLVGQSMGGYISQYAYLNHPERVQAIVIIGSTSIALPYSRWEIFALKASAPLFGLWPYGHFKKTIARNTAIKPEVQRYAYETASKLSRQEFLKIWKAVTLAVSAQGIADHYIDVPLLLTHGDQDNTGVIRRDAPRWAAYEPDVQYAVIPDAGHNANQDNPEFFNHVLLDFLRQRLPS